MAGKAKRSILIEILGDAKDYAKSTRQAEGATKSFEKKIEAVGKAIAGAYVAKKVIDFGFAAAKAAVDDAASQKVLATALKNTTKATDAQVASAEDWITKMQAQKVFADTDLRVALATLTGATKNVAAAQGLMSLAMDTARAKGVPLATVADALAKAHSGNTRALLALVPGLKQAGEGTIDFATAQERLNQQVRGQADAWASTDAGKLESLNLQWGEMQETLGTALLPVMSRVVDVVAGVFGWFNSLDEGTRELIVDIGLLAAGGYAAVSAINAVKNIADALGGTVKSTTLSIGAMIAALAALDYWEKFTEDAGEAKDAMNEFLVATDKASFATNEGVLELANSFTKLAERQGMAQGDISKTLDVLSAGFRDGSVSANLLGEQMQETFDQLLDVDPSKAFDVAMALDNIRQAADAGNESAREHLDAYGLTNDIIDDFVTKAENAAAAQQILGGATADTTEELDAGAKSAKTYISRIRDLQDAFSGLLGVLDDRDAVRSMQTGFDDLGQAAEEAYFAAASGSEDADEKSRAYQQSIDDQKRKVIAFADEVGNIPREQVSEILALIDQGKLDEAEMKLLWLERNRRIMFSAVLDPATDKITVGSLGNIHLSARGRYVDRPMITAVGEGNRREVILPLENQGRMTELLSDPRVLGPVTDALPAARVTSADLAYGAAGAGGGRYAVTENHVHIAAGAVVSDRELTEMIADGLSTAARRTGSDVTTRRRVPI